jgi:hypothetical protein
VQNGEASSGEGGIHEGVALLTVFADVGGVVELDWTSILVPF